MWGAAHAQVAPLPNTGYIEDWSGPAVVITHVEV